MKGKNLKYLVLGFALAATGLYALGVGGLTAFTPGTAIKSADVNNNFTVLRSAIEALEAPIGPARLAVTGTAADGKVLKLQGGGLTWADDNAGAGGGGDITGVTAGAGLAGGGASGDVSLSLADGGVTSSKLANDSVTAAKTADEPGIRLAATASGVLGPFDTSPTAMQSITINAPASGWVHIVGTVSLELVHTSGSPTTAYSSINTVNTSVGVGSANIDSVPSGAASGSYWHTTTVQAVLNVSAGNNTFYFMGARGPFGTVNYNRLFLTATFLPTAY